jgi:methyltransferase (TIGR00027 family)
MLDDKVSCTAIGTAYLRAAHQVFEARPRIFDDPVALSMLGPTALKRIKDRAAHYQTPEMRALRARVVLRSRFAEDRLAAAVLRGVTQYVILGAGCDTFALRQPPWARPLRIFEVDHPRTQEGKRSRLSAAGLTIPENVALVGNKNPSYFIYGHSEGGQFVHRLVLFLPDARFARAVAAKHSAFHT